ncbi:hypothetical protein [Microcoleus sp. herbarium14]|uniref:hypothetical protein n=1 Tax=Microcoleus sp. herbarium14 TaxID=3055439 RepID=UPI002FD6846B
MRWYSNTRSTKKSRSRSHKLHKLVTAVVDRDRDPVENLALYWDELQIVSKSIP